MDRLLQLLDKNARLTTAQLAAMLGRSEDTIEAQLQELERTGVIRGYKAIINWAHTGREHVTALIELRVTPKRDLGFDEIARIVMAFEEVEAVYLMSGGYDLAVMLSGRTFQEIAMFVAKRLSPLESILSTATHFVLTCYKEHGLPMEDPPRDERRNVLL